MIILFRLGMFILTLLILTLLCVNYLHANEEVNKALPKHGIIQAYDAQEDSYSDINDRYNEWDVVDYQNER